MLNSLQSNFSNTETERTELSVRIREVSVRGHYDDVTFMTPLIVQFYKCSLAKTRLTLVFKLRAFKVINSQYKDTVFQ